MSVSLLTILSLVLPSASIASFSDVDPNDPSASAINALQSRRIFSGYPDGSFRPEQPINRAELMKIIVQGALDLDPSPAGQDCFPDVHAEWFAPFVCHASEAKWVQGYPDGLFHPERTLNEAEALKMIVVSLAPQETVDAANCPGDAWYSTYLCRAERRKIVRAADFHPAASMTRGLAAAWLHAALPNDQTPASAQASSSSARSSSSPASPSRPEVSSSASPDCAGETAWTCGDWSACDPYGEMTRICTKKMSAIAACHLSVTQSDAPPTRAQCNVTNPDRMKANLDAWTEARKALTSKMENMSHQPAGQGCMSTLAQIDEEWVSGYNDYINIYNNLANGGDWRPAIKTVELKMQDVLKRIDQAPTYCY